MLHNFYSLWLDISTYSYLNISLCLQSKIKEKNSIGTKNERDTIYMVLMITIVYTVYKKCLLKYFRELGLAFLRRNYLSVVLWNLGFTSFIILLMTFQCDFFFESEISVLIIKTYYIHYYGILMFNNNKFKKFQNFLLIMGIFGLSESSLHPSFISIFLFKSIEVLILSVCQLAYLMKIRQSYSKSIYIIYCIIWIYFYVVCIPTNLLIHHQEVNNFSNIGKLLLYIWFTTQCFDFVWLGFIANFRSTNFMEFCLFQTCHSVESKYLISKLYNYHKTNKIKDENTVKKELWQSLFCAMVLKKKLRKLRQSKEANTKTILDSENMSEKVKTN